MNDYYLQAHTYRQLMVEYSYDILSDSYTPEEWANLVDMVVTLHRGEGDKLSPNKNLKRMGFGMTK